MVVDLPIVLAIPDLKIYAWCRCKLVADGGYEAHFLWHGLIHFPKLKLASWKMQSHHTGIKFSSKKNTFKQVICFDRAVGVLCYVACKDGQIVRWPDGDGLVTHPHTQWLSSSCKG